MEISCSGLTSSNVMMQQEEVSEESEEVEAEQAITTRTEPLTTRDVEAPDGGAYDDDNDDDIDGIKKKSNKSAKMSHITQQGVFPMREVKIPFIRGSSSSTSIKFNIFTSLFALAFLWGLSIWCMVDQETANTKLIEARGNVTQYFTWFYVGTNPGFMFFMIFVAFRYGSIRLGPKDSKPEFDDITYFAMLFSAGIGVGLFFYGVSEPLWHQSSHWYANAGYHNQDELDMWALNLTVFHWGITGWSQYLVLAVCTGLASYHFGLPLTLRSCFYPLLGEYTWGWIGDIIDGYAIVTTVAGVCTSLGLGAYQIAAGLQRVGVVGSDLSDDELKTIHLVTIWLITIVATASVVSGLSIGIKYLSLVGFSLGMLLLFLVFVMDKTAYILNLIVQEFGFYFQWSILLLNFWTDAFGQLREGEGRAVDGKAAAVWWMDTWTIFYIGWWVSWAAFVGLFIARISKGRTVRSVILWSYVCPLVYTIIWFGVFGGVGLRQSRQAEELKGLGETFYNDTDEFLHPGSTYCYDVPQQDVVYNGTTIFTNHLVGVTPVCTFDTDEAENAWFNVLFSYSFPDDFAIGYGFFLSWLSIFALAIYFITSSDSGSLIVDHLASNGHEDTHWIQRIFWAFTEGLVASALLVAGGTKALRALQGASILSGLPFTLFLVFMCMAILKMCRLSEHNTKENKDVTLHEDYEKMGKFSMPVQGGILNIFEFIISLGRVNESRVERGMNLPTSSQTIEFFKSLFLPFIAFYSVTSQQYPKAAKKNILVTVIYTLMFIGWIALFASMTVSRGIHAFAWTAFFINGCIMTNLRRSVRERFHIEGNVIADFLLGSFFYPQVLTQMVLEFDTNPDAEKDHDA